MCTPAANTFYRRSSARLQLGNEVFKKQERRLTRSDGEVLLVRLVHARPERRIGENHMDTVALREIGDLLRERIAINDVRRFESVQDAVHLRSNVRERLDLAAEEGPVGSMTRTITRISERGV